MALSVVIDNVNSTSSSSQAQMNMMHRVASAQFGRPSLELLQNKREYIEKCVPLYKAALKGDWKAAKVMIEKDKRLVNAGITKGWETVLHVAAGSGHCHFVDQLLHLLHPQDLELQDFNGNTAFCFAAAVGNVTIALKMMDKNGGLATIRGGEGVTPLHMAALQGRTEMANYLYSLTLDAFQHPKDWELLFFYSLNTALYDLALQMLETKPMLVVARNENYDTALHLLARRPLRFTSHGRKAIPLVRCLWTTLVSLDYTETEIRIMISDPSQVIFDAASVGNFEFLAVLMGSYPDFIWEINVKNQSIIHIAVLHRHASIFNLIHELGSIKDLIVTFEDDEGNNMLHCAAKLAPSYQLNLLSGAAFQIMHELLWFEEVKKIMLPLHIEKKNSKGKTPRQVFTEEHKELLQEGESWTKRTSKNCMLVSTLIATGVFVAAFTIPGGYDNATGTPHYLTKPTFLIFAISDTSALISSAISILMFLSVLLSRYAEDDFLKSLPSKLMLGLMALFVSVTNMMIAFTTAFFITYYHGLKWVPSFVSVVAFLPIPFFVFLQYSLWYDIIHSLYFCNSLFQPCRFMLR